MIILDQCLDNSILDITFGFAFGRLIDQRYGFHKEWWNVTADGRAGEVGNPDNRKEIGKPFLPLLVDRAMNLVSGKRKAVSGSRPTISEARRNREP